MLFRPRLKLWLGISLLCYLGYVFGFLEIVSSVERWRQKEYVFIFLLVILVMVPHAYWMYLPIKLLGLKDKKAFLARFIMLTCASSLALISLVWLVLRSEESLISDNLKLFMDFLGLFIFVTYILNLLNSARALRNITKVLRISTHPISGLIAYFYLPLGMFFIFSRVSKVLAVNAPKRQTR